MTIHRHCVVCGQELDAFDIKSHKCVPKDRVEELEKEKIRAYDNGFEDGQKSHALDRIAELEFENKAFRDELFRRGSMDSCSQAAAMHGFVSPRQAADDARGYIAEILRKASDK